MSEQVFKNNVVIITGGVERDWTRGSAATRAVPGLIYDLALHRHARGLLSGIQVIGALDSRPKHAGMTEP